MGNNYLGLLNIPSILLVAMHAFLALSYSHNMGA